MQKTDFDYIIIGAGPAGLQLGYYLEKAARDYLILEAGAAPATFFKTYPRHRKLISINKIYTGYDDPEINLRWDWHSLLLEDAEILFKEYSREYFPNAEAYVQYCADFAQRFHLKIQYGSRVMSVGKAGKFQITDQQGRTYRARRLVIATGVSKPYIPAIPGIELAEDYSTVSVDPENFANQRVLILGKGNSAFETADNLVGTTSLIHMASPHPLKLAWQSHFVGHLRAVNNNILDTYQLKSQNAILDATIERIEQRDGQFVVSVCYTHAHDEREELVYDRVITCTGFRFDASIFADACRPQLAIHDRFPTQTSEWESMNVKGLYFAGTLTQMRDYKKSASGFIHGFRYNVRALHRILEKKYHDQPWPSYSVAPTASSLAAAIIKRINHTSALWQQFGFLCDLIVLPEQGDEGLYYEEVPIDYIRDSAWGRNVHYYIITLEYGPNHDAADPFSVTRIERTDTERAALSNFLHPIVRSFAGSELLAEHHIIEDLEAEWCEDEHIQPLIAFLSADLKRSESKYACNLVPA